MKILRRRQRSSDGLQLALGALPPLGDEFCSLGQGLDYYERLAQLPEDLRRDILMHLRDALSYPEHAESFFEEEGCTGHKIVMHAAASMVAYTEPKAIVLIDEPESHLHPPLLAAFMHAVRLILDRNDAFAVIATHSPVVVQETLGRHVSVVRRSGTATMIGPPRIETYGESIGEITDEVFGLNSDATDFHKILKTLVEAEMSLEAIEELFERGLSLQARAYVMSELAQKA